MSPPYMPFYVGDYLADTGHLNAAENGAYLMLIMHYWRTGALPVGDELRRRVSRMTHREWERSKTTVLAFFSADGKHKRIDEELSRANHKSCVLRENAFKSHLGRKERNTSGRDELAPAETHLSRVQLDKPLKPHDVALAEAKQGQVQIECIPEPEPKPKKEAPTEPKEIPSVSCPKPPKTVSNRARYPEEFLVFWKAYPTDAGMAKKEAFTAWQKLAPEDRSAALTAIPAWKAHCATIRDYRMLHACRFLSQRRFEGVSEVAERTASQVFVKIGSAQWRAWEHWQDQTSGKRPPVNKEGTGWWFRSEWPPKSA